MTVAILVYIKEKTLVNFMLEHWFGLQKKKKDD